MRASGQAGGLCVRVCAGRRAGVWVCAGKRAGGRVVCACVCGQAGGCVGVCGRAGRRAGCVCVCVCGQAGGCVCVCAGERAGGRVVCVRAGGRVCGCVGGCEPSPPPLPSCRTPLLRDGENYRQREMEAMQLANEIESKTTVCRHALVCVA